MVIWRTISLFCTLMAICAFQVHERWFVHGYNKVCAAHLPEAPIWTIALAAFAMSLPSVLIQNRLIFAALMGLSWVMFLICLAPLWEGAVLGYDPFRNCDAVDGFATPPIMWMAGYLIACVVYLLAAWGLVLGDFGWTLAAPARARWLSAARAGRKHTAA